MIYFAQIPHQHKPSIWTAADWQDAAARLAQRSDGQQPRVTEYNSHRDIREMFGEDDAPPKLASIANDQTFPVFEIVSAPNSDPEYTAAGTYESNLKKAVLTWAASDVHRLIWAESENEFLDACTEYNGHQCHALHDAVMRKYSA